jgi:hypothetical protein
MTTAAQVELPRGGRAAKDGEGMSTISGEESVRPNWAPRRTRPGLTGRRLVLMCANEHRIHASAM